MTRLRLGACLSLTGRYGRFGRQAANGLRVWQGLVGERVELRIEDDASDPEQLAARFPGVARRSDLLLGPYSTQLMRRAGALMADIDGVLWNQGGSGDDVQAACPGRIVSVLAPTSRYSLPFVRRLAEHREQVPLWVVRARGKFGRQVAAGAVAAAKREGLEVVEERADEEASFSDVPDRWDLFCVGMFEDDVALVRSAKSAARPPRMICSVAAAVHDFAAGVGGVDGVFGIAQWFPGAAEDPELGPTEADFLSEYSRLVGSAPDYPAVQAMAGAVLATRCAELAGSVAREALWEAAASLETSTLFGDFKVDPSTGVQTKHVPVLLRWQGESLGLVEKPRLDQ